VIGLVSHCQINPGLAHWQAIQRIMHYLYGTVDLALCCQGEGLKLRECIDANWGGDPDKSSSTSGYVFTLGRGAISLSNKK